jgi:periplasmic copper chaperone A
MHRSLICFLLIAASVGASGATAGAATDVGSAPLVVVDADSGVKVQESWARATPGGASAAAAYVTLMGGTQADALVGVSTPLAKTADVHDSINDNGVMKMRSVASVPIPAGKIVALTPGGFHIMLTGLSKPLTAGDSFPLTLQFQHAAPITVQVKVRPLGGKSDGGMGNMKM